MRRAQRGGDDWPNLVTLCSTCHQWVHANPIGARAGGWLLLSGDDPREVPLDHWLWPAGPVFLEDGGGIKIAV